MSLATRRICAAVLGAAGILATASGSAEELLSVSSTAALTTNNASLTRGVPTGTTATQSLLFQIDQLATASCSTSTQVCPAIDQVLPTRDGTDVLFFGHQSAGSFFYRIGRSAVSGALEGNFQSTWNLSDALMDHAVSLPGSSSKPPAAAWIGAEQRMLALALSDMKIHLYDPLLGAPVASTTATDWGIADGNTNLALTFNARFVAAAGPHQIFAAANDGTPTIQRIWFDGTKVNTQACTINAGMAFTVTGLVGIPASGTAPNDRGGVIVLVEDQDNPPMNSEAIPLSADCTGTINKAFTSEAPVCTGGALSPGGTSPRLFCSGPTFPGANLASWSYGAGSPASLSPLNVTANQAVGGSVATLSALDNSGASGLLVAGQPSMMGYQVLTTTDGSTYMPQFSMTTAATGDTQFIAGSTPFPTAGQTMPVPTFGLQKRVFDLYDSPSLGPATRYGYSEIYGGATPPTITVYAGACKNTSVFNAVSNANGITVQMQPVLAAGQASGTYTFPPAASGTAVIAFAQEGNTGEDCTMLLNASGGGGGALVRIKGTGLGQRAMILLLDKSGSMGSAINPNNPVDTNAADAGYNPYRYSALQDALSAFANVVSQMPDAQQINFGLTQFNHDSNFGVSAFPGTMLSANVPVISPIGGTNIRGAVKTAADWLATNATVKGATSKAIILFTDGEHNTVGSPDTNDPTTDYYNDSPTCLEQTGTASCNQTNDTPPQPVNQPVTSQYVTGTDNVNRLYSVGLGISANEDSLKRLTGNVNSAAYAQGFLQYTNTGPQLDSFFHKVLWNYLNATETVDPVVTIDDNTPYSTLVPVDPGDLDAVVSVVWHDSKRALGVTLLDAQTNQELVATRLCHTLGNSVACYLQLNKDSDLAIRQDFKVQVAKPVQGDDPGPVTAMVTVAGRPVVRLSASFGSHAYVAGDNLQAQVTLTRQGLPLRGALSVTGHLTRPNSGLGTALTTTSVTPTAIANFIKMNPDFTPAEAKLALLSGTQVPVQTGQDIVFLDDGHNGDGAANDGVYGAILAAPVPGAYSLTVHAVYGTSTAGERAREGSAFTQVGVALDADKTIQLPVNFTPPTGNSTGTLVVSLKPQDAAGNLLGPGLGGEMIFLQGGRALPTKIVEPNTLDGTYTATITGIGPTGPVILRTDGGSIPLIANPGGTTRTQQSGCSCRLGPSSEGPLAVPVVMLLGLGAVVLLRRRRTLRTGRPAPTPPN